MMSARSTFKQEHPLGAPSPARDPLDNKPRGRESEISDVEGVHAARASSSSAGRARGFTRRARRASASRASRVDLARARGANPRDRRPRASRPAPGRCSRAPRVSVLSTQFPAGRSVPPPRDPRLRDDARSRVPILTQPRPPEPSAPLTQISARRKRSASGRSTPTASRCVRRTFKRARIYARVVPFLPARASSPPASVSAPGVVSTA